MQKRSSLLSSSSIKRIYNIAQKVDALRFYLQSMNLLDVKKNPSIFASQQEEIQDLKEAFSVLLLSLDAKEDLNQDEVEFFFKLLYEQFLHKWEKIDSHEIPSFLLSKLEEIKNSNSKKNSFEMKVSKSLNAFKECKTSFSFKNVLEQSLKKFSMTPESLSSLFLKNQFGPLSRFYEKTVEEIGLTWKEEEPIPLQWEAKADIEELFFKRLKKRLESFVFLHSSWCELEEEMDSLYEIKDFEGIGKLAEKTIHSYFKANEKLTLTTLPLSPWGHLESFYQGGLRSLNKDHQPHGLVIQKLFHKLFFEILKESFLQYAKPSERTNLESDLNALYEKGECGTIWNELSSLFLKASQADKSPLQDHFSGLFEKMEVALENFVEEAFQKLSIECLVEMSLSEKLQMLYLNFWSISSELSLELEEAFINRDVAKLVELEKKRKTILSLLSKTNEESEDSNCFPILMDTSDFEMHDLKLTNESSQTVSMAEEMKLSLQPFIDRVFNSFSLKTNKEDTVYDRYLLAKKTFQNFYLDLKKDIQEHDPDLEEKAKEAYETRDVGTLHLLGKELAYQIYLKALEKLPSKEDINSLRDLSVQLKNENVFEKTRKTLEALQELELAYFSKPLRILLKDQAAAFLPDIEEVVEAPKVFKTPEQVFQEIKTKLFHEQVEYLRSLTQEQDIDPILCDLVNRQDEDASLAAYALLKERLSSEKQDDSFQKMLYEEVVEAGSLEELQDLQEKWKAILESDQASPFKHFLLEKGFKQGMDLTSKEIERLEDLKNWFEYNLVKQDSFLSKSSNQREHKSLSLEELCKQSKELAVKNILRQLQMKPDPSLSFEDLSYEAVYKKVKEVKNSSGPLYNTVHFLFTPNVKKETEQSLFPWNKPSKETPILDQFFKDWGVKWDPNISVEENCADKMQTLRLLLRAFLKQQIEMGIPKEEVEEKYHLIEGAIQEKDLSKIESLIAGVSLTGLLKEVQIKIQDEKRWFLDRPINHFVLSNWRMSYFDRQKDLEKGFSTLYQGLKQKIQELDLKGYDFLLDSAFFQRHLPSLTWLYSEIGYQNYVRKAKHPYLKYEDQSSQLRFKKTLDHLLNTSRFYHTAEWEALVLFPEKAFGFDEEQTVHFKEIEDRIASHKKSKGMTSFISYLEHSRLERPILRPLDDELARFQEQFIESLRGKVHSENESFFEEEAKQIDLWDFDKMDALEALAGEKKKCRLSALISLKLFKAAASYLQEEDERTKIFSKMLCALEDFSAWELEDFFCALLEKKLYDCIRVVMEGENLVFQERACFAFLGKVEKAPESDMQKYLETFVKNFFLLSLSKSKELVQCTENLRSELQANFNWLETSAENSSLKAFLVQEGVLNEQGKLLSFWTPILLQKRLLAILTCLREKLEASNQTDLQELDQLYRMQLAQDFIAKHSIKDNQKIKEICFFANSKILSWVDAVSYISQNFLLEQKSEDFALSLKQLKSPIPIEKNDPILAKLQESLLVTDRSNHPKSVIEKPFQNLGLPIERISSVRECENLQYLLHKFKLSLLNQAQRLIDSQQQLEKVKNEIEQAYEHRKWQKFSEIADGLSLLEIRNYLKTTTPKERKEKKMIQNVSKYLSDSKIVSLTLSQILEEIKRMEEVKGSEIELLLNGIQIKEWGSFIKKYHSYIGNEETKDYSIYEELVTIKEECFEKARKFYEESQKRDLPPIYEKMFEIAYVTNEYRIMDWLLNYIEQKNEEGIGESE